MQDPPGDGTPPPHDPAGGSPTPPPPPSSDPASEPSSPGPRSPGAPAPPPSSAPAPVGDAAATRRGVVIGSAVGAGIIAVGVVVGLTVFGGDDDPDAASTTTIDSDVDTDSTVTGPATDPTVSLEPTTTVTDTTTTEAPPTTQAGDPAALVGAAVRFATFDTVLDEASTAEVLLGLGAAPDVVVAQPTPPRQLCAALANPTPLAVSVLWELDGQAVREIPSTELSAPSGGDCLADPAGLDVGSYQVLFTATNGTEAPIVTFTVGAEATTQTFVNDTGRDVCSLEIAPTTTGYFEPYFDASADVYVPVDGVATVPLAAVEHEARAVPCGEAPLDGFFFQPDADGAELRLSDGAPTGPEQVDDEILAAAFGLIGSSTETIDQVDRDALVADLLDPDAPLVVASTDPSRTLCAVYELPAPFDGAMVWEYNGEEVLRNPVSVGAGTVVDCVPPGGDIHGDGAYQAYLQRGTIASGVATFTLGREQTALSFVNDTGVEICEVGFSPDLANFYTIYSFLGSEAFGGALLPDETFQIAAPLIDNDIRAIDCDGQSVAENFSIPPTDAIVSLLTGEF